MKRKQVRNSRSSASGRRLGRERWRRSFATSKACRARHSTRGMRSTTRLRCRSRVGCKRSGTECAAETIARRCDAGQCRSDGPAIEKAASAAARCETVAHLSSTFGMSERRACAVIGADCKSVRYRSPSAGDEEIGRRLRELPGNGDSSAIAGCTSCFKMMASPFTARRRSASMARRADTAAESGTQARRSRLGIGTGAHNSQPTLGFRPRARPACHRAPLRVLNIVRNATRQCLRAIAETSISGKEVGRRARG